MERLTKEQLENYRNTYDNFDGVESNIFEEICNELIEYKSLEEELGIDLITLFKALKDGIEVGNYQMRVCLKNLKLIFRQEDNEYVFIYDYYLVKLKDYGKSWALSRNDLEEK